MTVQLLCHFDGTNGSTTFTDAVGHTLTASGVTVNTALPKFGTGAGDFTSSSAANISIGTPADFNLGAGQFTVEAFIYFTSAPGAAQSTVLSQWFTTASNLGWNLGMVSGGLAFYWSTTGADTPNIAAAWTPTLNTWYHVAVDRDAANVIRLYLNGVIAASTTSAATIFASTRACEIGNDSGNTHGFLGRIDEARVVTGQAMYGGAFPPPPAPFTLPSTTYALATQAALEAWVAPNPAAQVTQTGLEAWYANGIAQVTQVSLEEWASANPPAQVTQVAIEMWASVALYTPPPFIPPPPPEPPPTHGKGHGGKPPKGGPPKAQAGAPALQSEVSRFEAFKPRHKHRAHGIFPPAITLMLLGDSAATSAAVTATVAIGAALMRLSESSHGTDALSASAIVRAALTASSVTSDTPHHGDSFPGTLSESAATSAAITAVLAAKASLTAGATTTAAMAGFRKLVTALAATATGSAALSALARHGAPLAEGSTSRDAISASAKLMAALIEAAEADDEPAATAILRAALDEGAGTLDADTYVATTHPLRHSAKLIGRQASPDIEGEWRESNE